VLHQLTVDFMMDNMNRIKNSLGIKQDGVRLINIDGKQARGTGRSRSHGGAFPNLQMLNIYDASNGICIAMKDIENKSNEIPAAQVALGLLDIKGAVLTCDALNTQKETLRIIAGKEKKGDYVAALKKNHHLFYEEVDAFFSQETLRAIRKAGVGFVTSINKAHSKVERRNYYLTDHVKWFAGWKDWEKLRSFICTETILTDTATGEVTTERRIFISSIKDAELCAEAIRGHWAIENILHWHLDVSFGDDADTTTDKHAYMNFSTFRRMALALCKLAQPFMKCSIKDIRWGVGLDFKSQLGLILGTLDEAYLENALRSANRYLSKPSI
jgi:predicted transposase YbfD/YdcC